MEVYVVIRYSYWAGEGGYADDEDFYLYGVFETLEILRENIKKIKINKDHLKIIKTTLNKLSEINYYSELNLVKFEGIDMI